MLGESDIPAMPPRCRLQWEPAQKCHVLLYPEGMVQLSESAAEILKRVDGTATIAAIIASLERAYSGADLRQDVMEFLDTAHGRGWITIKDR